MADDSLTVADARVRCDWCVGSPLMIDYHDKEWGTPLHDDTRLFEAIVLDGAQAGLSWSTILNKREGYRRAFAGFDPRVVMEFDESDYERLLVDPGIVRNRAKIRSAIANARAFLQIQEEFGSFDAYWWQFVDGKPIVNNWKTTSQLPASTPLSDTISKDLKKRGFSFVGTTIIYAMMQATGIVNDHMVDCFRHSECS